MDTEDSLMWEEGARSLVVSAKMHMQNRNTKSRLVGTDYSFSQSVILFVLRTNKFPKLLAAR